MVLSPHRGQCFILVFIMLYALCLEGARADGFPPFVKATRLNPAVSAAQMFFLRAPLVKGEESVPLQMATYKGKWVFLHVWATWCGPCIAELPRLEASYAGFNDYNKIMLSVSIDPGMTAQRMTVLWHTWHLQQLPPLYDPARQIAGVLDTSLLPVTYVIDPQGDVRLGLYGPAAWSKALMQQAITLAGS